MTTYKIVENAVQAKKEIEELVARGYSHDDIYIFAHDKKRGDDITDALHTENVGIKEQGFIDSMKNLFSSRGDELRSKMESVGLTTDEANTAERELDQGRLVVVAHK